MKIDIWVRVSHVQHWITPNGPETDQSIYEYFTKKVDKLPGREYADKLFAEYPDANTVEIWDEEDHITVWQDPNTTVKPDLIYKREDDDNE